MERICQCYLSLEKGKQLFFFAVVVSIFIIFSCIANAAEYVSMTVEPKDIGVFYENKTQQMKAYGFTASGQKVNITNEVDWYIDPAGDPYSGQGTAAGQVATIDKNGLVTIHGNWGRVTVHACLPKGCGKSFGPNLNPILGALLRPSYTVSAALIGGNGSCSPEGDSKVKSGNVLNIDLTPDAGYEVVTSNVGGSCPTGSIINNFTRYRTGQIKDDCNVDLQFSLKPVVTPSVHSTDNNGSMSPNVATPVYTNDTQVFNLTPTNSSYEALDDISDITCPNPVFSGPQNTILTVGPVVADCDVEVHFTAKPSYTVSSSVSGGNGTISPTPSTTIQKWDTATFTLTPDSSSYVASSVTGDCPAGTLTYNPGDNTSTYVTGEIMGNCSVIAHFSEQTVTVNSSVTGGNGTVTPQGDTDFPEGGTAQFTLNPATGYIANLVSDNCGAGGSFNGDNTTYTTANLSGACSVVFEFIPLTYTLTVNPPATGGVYSGADILDPEIVCGPIAVMLVGLDILDGEVCAYTYNHGDTVTMTAIESINIVDETSVEMVGAQWSGITCNEGATGPTCTFDITGNTTVTVTAP